MIIQNKWLIKLNKKSKDSKKKNKCCKNKKLKFKQISAIKENNIKTFKNNSIS